MKTKVVETAPPTSPRLSMGLSPAVLANRKPSKPSPWCKETDIEFDSNCDPDFPREILYKDVVKATLAIKEDIPKSPIRRSRWCKKFGMELYYKVEIFHPTGSYEVRTALYCLKRLSKKQKGTGVISSSLGNWSLSLAYQGFRLNVPITLVIPNNTSLRVIERCKEYGATVIVHGNNLGEAKRHAMILAPQYGLTYINGYDHPHVIAASGMIGLEILDQIPNVDVIIIPVKCGNLLAGISAAIKHKHPEILIYGVEPKKSCGFFKAMENGRPYTTCTDNIEVGYNCFHTARSLVDKLVLVNDDWISQAVKHLVTEEMMIVEHIGAYSLAALLSVPEILPELKFKTVVCVISGGNIDQFVMLRCIQRARCVEGAIIHVKIALPAEDTNMLAKVFSIVSAIGANLQQWSMSPSWRIDDDINRVYLQLSCEMRGIQHGCTLRRVLERVFPGRCEFMENPFAPVPICACFPGQK